jgi:hypothetical protein
MAVYDINITAEDIKNASAYTSLPAKEVLTRSVAQFCIEPVEVKADDSTPLPPMFRENRKLRSQFMMGILASLLGKEYTLQTVKIRGDESAEEHQLAWCMDEDDYQLWASSHVMNQLERLKKSKDTETVNKVFDFLYDYKAIEMMLLGAIRDELDVANDPFNRAMRYFNNMAMQSAMNSMMDGELRKLIDERKGENNG